MATAHSLHETGEKNWGAVVQSDAGSAAVKLIDHSNFDRRKIVGERPEPCHAWKCTPPAAFRSQGERDSVSDKVRLVK